MQLGDFSPVLSAQRELLSAYGSPEDSTLTAPFWTHEGSKYARIEVIPTYEQPVRWIKWWELPFLASSRSGVTINAGYFARQYPAAIEAATRARLHELTEVGPRGDTLYVLHPQLAAAWRDVGPPHSELRTIDGLHVLIREETCSGCRPSDLAFAAAEQASADTTRPVPRRYRTIESVDTAGCTHIRVHVRTGPPAVPSLPAAMVVSVGFVGSRATLVDVTRTGIGTEPTSVDLLVRREREIVVVSSPEDSATAVGEGAAGIDRLEPVGCPVPQAARTPASLRSAPTSPGAPSGRGT